MTLKGSCHCGTTQFEVDAAPASLTRCTCTFCSKRGVLWAYYTPAGFGLTTPRSRVSTYKWNSFTVEHHHCAICGCGTYTETPTWIDGEPDFDKPRIGVNARLFEDFDLDALPVETIDGRKLW